MKNTWKNFGHSIDKREIVTGMIETWSGRIACHLKLIDTIGILNDGDFAIVIGAERQNGAWQKLFPDVIMGVADEK